VTNDANLRGMGILVLLAAFALTVSWLPALAYLSGARWASPWLVDGCHRFAFGFLLGAPFAYGAGVWRESRRPGAEPGLVLSWLLRCQIPLTVYAVLVYWVMHVVPQATVPVIVGMMCSGAPLAVYGAMLKSEGSP